MNRRRLRQLVGLSIGHTLRQGSAYRTMWSSPWAPRKQLEGQRKGHVSTSIQRALARLEQGGPHVRSTDDAALQGHDSSIRGVARSNAFYDHTTVQSPLRRSDTSSVFPHSPTEQRLRDSFSTSPSSPTVEETSFSTLNDSLNFSSGQLRLPFAEESWSSLSEGSPRGGAEPTLHSSLLDSTHTSSASSPHRQSPCLENHDSRSNGSSPLQLLDRKAAFDNVFSKK